MGAKRIGGYILLGPMVLICLVNLLYASNNCKENNLWYIPSLINLMVTSTLFGNHFGGNSTFSEVGSNINYLLYVIVLLSSALPFSVGLVCDEEISIWNWLLGLEAVLALVCIVMEKRVS